MKTASTLLATFLLTIPLAVGAEVYRHVDEDGNVTYSDEAREGSEQVEVNPVSTVTLPSIDEIPRQEENNNEQEQEERQTYQQISFNAPADEQAFWSGSGNIEFSVSSEPPLMRGHMYQISLDGQIVGQSRSGTVAVQNVFRGTHEATVSVVNSEGQPVQTGEAITFTLHRPSVLN
jgi:hypothetical protein